MKKVLIVDQDLHFANTLKMYFRKNDYECTLCTDAKDVDGIIDNQIFDLVMCSVQAMHKSGMELIVDLKGKLIIHNTPLILITPNNNPSVNANYKELAADAIVHKPISFSNLLITIREIESSKQGL